MLSLSGLNAASHRFGISLAHRFIAIDKIVMSTFLRVERTRMSGSTSDCSAGADYRNGEGQVFWRLKIIDA